MSDENKVNEQFLGDLAAIGQWLAGLESAEAGASRLEEMLVGQERNLLRILIDRLPDAMYIKNAKSQFIVNNMAHLQILGAQTQAEVIGKTDSDFFPEELAAQYYADEQAVLATGQPLLNREEPVPDQTSGQRHWVTTTKIPLHDSQGNIVGLVGISRDITHRKRAEAMLAQRAAQLALIHDVSSKIGTVMDLDSLLNRAALLVQEMFGYHHVALFLLDGEVALLKAIAGSYKPYFPPHHSQKLTRGIIGWVATHGDKVVANDISLEPRYISSIPDRTETRSELCLPIQVKGQTVGVLDIQSHHLNAFSENDVTAMKILTDQIAMAIENGRLYQAAQADLAERRRAETALKDYRDHLEELVEGRTAQLKMANEQLQQEITERRRVETALRESEERFRTLANFTYDWEYWIGPDGQYIYVSPSCERITGYKPEAFLENPALLEKITHPDDQEMVIEHHRQEMRRSPMAAIDFRIITRNGSICWIGHVCQPVYSVEGHFLGSRASNRDITKRKQVEEELRRYTWRLQTLQEIDRSILAAHSPEAVAQAALRHIQQLVPCLQVMVVEFDFDTQEAIILAAYPRHQEAYPGRGLPLTSFGIAEGLRRDEVLVVLDTAVDRAVPLGPGAGETAGQSRSSMDVPLIAAGELIGIIRLEARPDCTFAAEHIDIAREVAAQMALAIQQARLHQQVQRYAAELERRVAERTARLQEINDELESFTFSVSHDLRAPLRGVQGFATALLEDYVDQLEAEGQEYVERIVAAAQRMDKLIQDLLAYSRLGRADLRLQPVSLAAVLADVLTQLDRDLEERLATVTIVEPLPWVVGHHATLVQVVANLLSNAIKFVPPMIEPEVRIWTEPQEGGQVRLVLADNGIGIEPEYYERIFRMFERLHGIEIYPGTGVGLAIVRRAMVRMGGRVGLESALSRGSRFWIELPGAAKPAG